jgi:tetratricopeptide (TPR) repeat protein
MSLSKTTYLKDFKNAKSNLNGKPQTRETIPDDVLANYEGAVLSSLGRYEEAIKSYEEAIRIKPDYFDAWRNSAYFKIEEQDGI